MRIGFVFFLLIFILLIDQAHATGSLDENTKLRFSGVVDFSTGAVVEGKYRATTGTTAESNQYPHTVDWQWFGNPLARLNIDATPAPYLNISLGFEGSVFLSTFDPRYLTSKSSNGGLPIIPQFMDWRLHQAQGRITMIDYDHFKLDAAIGLMPYKYNPEVRNLGEFMFRSGTYPLYLTTEFNFPMARLSGLRIGFKYTPNELPLKFSFDQFVLTERENPPLNDFSFASILSLNIFNLFEVGAGVNLARLIPVNSKLDNPELAFYVKNERPMLDSLGNTVMTGDTGYYSFQGTKIMGRLTIDPFGMLREDEHSLVNQILGKNGGKFYSEVLVSGWKNYPVNATPKALNNNSAINKFGYTKRTERMPFMFGITLPFWKILDVCAFEFEKFPAPYPNDYYQAKYNAVLPIPTWVPEVRPQYQVQNNDTIPNSYDSTLYANNAKKGFYWSLHIKKQFLSNFSLVGQLARDHSRWKCNLGNSANYDTEEIFAKQNQWAWRLGVLYNF